MRLMISFAVTTITLGSLYALYPTPFAARLDPPAPVTGAVDIGGFLSVAGVRAPEGDLERQTETILEHIDGMLQAAGSRLSNTVSVRVSLKNQSDFAAMNEIYRRYLPTAPPARTTVISPLPDDALIEMSVTAAPNGVQRTVVNPAGWLTTNPYSYGIKSGDTLFMSGLISRNGRDNSTVKGTIHTQTWVAMENAAAILAAAGMTFKDVVSAQFHIVDPSARDEVYAVYRGYFTGDPPQPSTVVARLTSPDYLVEITLTARKH